MSRLAAALLLLLALLVPVRGAWAALQGCPLAATLPAQGAASGHAGTQAAGCAHGGAAQAHGHDGAAVPGHEGAPAPGHAACATCPACVPAPPAALPAVPDVPALSLAAPVPAPEPVREGVVPARLERPPRAA